jgi:hypothetical protein
MPSKVKSRPFDMLPGDRIFTDSPDSGDPACLCSRCGKTIEGNIVPIRVTDPLGVTERRYHPACIGIPEREIDQAKVESPPMRHPPNMAGGA